MNNATCGSLGCGTVFELSPNSTGGWTETIPYKFQGTADGASPTAALILDQTGSFYGTTGWGSSPNANCAGKCGAVFKLTPQSGGGWTESTLYSFQGNADEQSPTAGLIFDSTGDLYGATSGGFPPSGGTVFELSPSSGGGWTENALYTFQGTLLNGWTSNAGLIFDESGNLYGTTSFGGSSAGSANCIGNGTMGAPNGCGTVFELSSASGGGWTERVLYNFQGNADGGYPGAALISDQSGNLYSTASGGASSNCNGGCGVVFELSPIPSGTAATTTTLSLAPSSVSAGSTGPVVMTATIAPTSGSGTPTGTATFFNGSTQIATSTLSSGVTTLNYNASSLAAGTYSITATYSGDNTFAGSTSSAQTLTVTKPTYSMSATAVTVSPGASGSSTVTVSSTNGYAGTVTLACAVTSSPTGATDLPTCTSNQTATLSSNTTSATATVTVNTTAASSSALTWPQVGKGRKWAGAGGGAALAVLIILWMPRRRRNCQSLLGILVLMTAFGAAAGCGGGGGGTTPPPSNPGTTAGTYTITLTGTGNDSAKTTATTTFTLTVN